MKRLAGALGLGLALLISAPTIAKPVEPSATISVDDPTPEWGQTITLTADASVSGTYIACEFEHAGGTSFSSSVFDYTGDPYSDDVGLYAPNWPDHAAATGTCEVRLVSKYHGKTDIAGASLTFTVSP